MDNIKTWTELSVEESVRRIEKRDKWRKYVHGVANPRIEDGYRTEQNTITPSVKYIYTVSQKKTRHQTLAHNFPKC